MVSGNDDDLQGGVVGGDLAQEMVIHALRFGGRVGTVEYIACQEEQVYVALFYLSFQPFQEVEMLGTAVVFVKGLTQMPVGGMEDFLVDSVCLWANVGILFEK